MLDRRHFILGSATLMSACAMRASASGSATTHTAGRLFPDIYGRVPEYPHLLTVDELRQRTRRLEQNHPRLVSVRVIGQSKKGEPIELVSVGRGRRSALVVAGLHPNEPIGSLTIEFLIDQLVTNPELRDRLGYTWHFIKTIDPDGMRLNEGWLKGSRMPCAYLHDFFRPALHRQAEYTFPLTEGSVTFAASPPENVAWRQALDLTRPQFLYTLHNAEYGGAFFLTSRPFPALERELQKLPGDCGVQLSAVGEPFADIEERSAGIFSLPEPRAIIQAAQRRGEDAATAWPAGDSSTGYASRFGAFCFSAEVPYWDDARVFDHSRSDVTLRQVLREHLQRIDSGTPILERWASMLPAESETRTELLHSLKEALAGRQPQAARLRTALAAGKIAEDRLTVSESALYGVTLQLASLRPFAMLARLARAQGDVQAVLPAAAEAQAQDYIDDQLAAVHRLADLRIIPLRSLVGIQAVSGLMAAQLLADQAGNNGEGQPAAPGRRTST